MNDEVRCVLIEDIETQYIYVEVTDGQPYAHTGNILAMQRIALTSKLCTGIPYEIHRINPDFTFTRMSIDWKYVDGDYSIILTPMTNK